MALTERQIYDLNNMNKAAQSAKLGDLLSGNNEDESTKSRTATTKQVATQSVSVANSLEELRNDFNSLISKLKEAGVMAK